MMKNLHFTSHHTTPWLIIFLYQHLGEVFLKAELYFSLSLFLSLDLKPTQHLTRVISLTTWTSWGESTALCTVLRCRLSLCVFVCMCEGVVSEWQTARWGNLLIHTGSVWRWALGGMITVLRVMLQLSTWHSFLFSIPPARSLSASRLYVALCFIYSECCVRHSNVSARAEEIKLFFFLQLPVPFMANVSSPLLLFISHQTSGLL